MEIYNEEIRDLLAVEKDLKYEVSKTKISVLRHHETSN